MTKILSRSCIIIAGMHRSGTSALARVIGLLGCTLPKNLMPASETNASGYWESQRLSYFNDEILESAGSSWDDWASCTPDWIDSPAMAGFGRRAIEMYSEEYGESTLTVLKDPRICRLLPFWLPLLEEAKIKPYVIIPIRNPKEVAASLVKRDGSETYYNHLLWLRHVLEAEAGSRGTRRAFVTYDDLLENYSTVVTATETRLGLKWPRRSARTSEEIEAYLSEQHRHEKLSTKSMSNDLSSSDWLRHTYEIMLRWAESGEDNNDYPTLDAMLADFNASAQRFSRVIYRGKLAVTQLAVVQSAAAAREIEITQLTEQTTRASQEAAAHAAAQEVKYNTVEQELVAVRNELLLARLQFDEKAHALEAQLLNQDLILSDKQSELELATKSLSVSETEHVEMVSRLEAELLTRDLILSDKQSELELATKSLSDSEAEHVELVSRLEAELISRDQTLADKNAQLVATARMLQEVEAKHENKLVELEQSNASLVKGFRATFSLAEQDNEDLSNKLKTAELALETLEQTRRSQMFEMNQIRSSLAQKKAEADDYHFEIKRFDAEKAELSKAINDLKSEMLASRAQGGKLAAQIQDIVTSMDKTNGIALLPKRFKRSQNRKILSAAGVVNHEWYLKTNPDVGALGIDPTLHYASHGASEGRAPNPEYDAIKKHQDSST